MYKKLILLSILCCLGLPTTADVSIGLNLQVFPQLVPVPNYPVYYVPGMNSNYFFYDGMYWIYENDNWYASTWYNGPWNSVEPALVPSFILRIPINYYGRPPTYFSAWQSNEAPRWGEHWGATWSQRRNGWDHWNHSGRVEISPLPIYQRQYSGRHYPVVAQQQVMLKQHPESQPHDALVRQQFQALPGAATSPPPQQDIRASSPRNGASSNPAPRTVNVGPSPLRQQIAAPNNPPQREHNAGHAQQRPPAEHAALPFHEQAAPPRAQQAPQQQASHASEGRPASKPDEERHGEPSGEPRR